jgi:anthrone oxygenase-like protein
MTSLAGQLALTAAATFAGAAVYVLACEQRARLTLDDRALLAEFKPSYKHGAALQAPLSLVGCVLGLIAWWQLADWRWLAGAIAIVAPWPWTLAVIRPVNTELLATDLAKAGAHTRELIVTWGHLHLGRLAFGVAATLLFLWASLSTP